MAPASSPEFKATKSCSVLTFSSGKGEMAGPGRGQGVTVALTAQPGQGEVGHMHF